MSFHFTLHIGPYAEWRVRLGKKPLPSESEEAWYESLIEGEILFQKRSCAQLLN